MVCVTFNTMEVTFWDSSKCFDQVIQHPQGWCGPKTRCWAHEGMLKVQQLTNLPW